MIYLNLFLISIIIIIIIDISDFVENIKGLISYIITKGKIIKTDFNLKPFDCSFCMIFWVCLVYIFIFENINPTLIAYILCLSVFSTSIKSLIFTIKNIFDYFLHFINKKIIN